MNVFLWNVCVCSSLETLGCSAVSGLPHTRLSCQPHQLLRERLSYSAPAAVWKGECSSRHFQVHILALVPLKQTAMSKRPNKDKHFTVTSGCFKMLSVIWSIKFGALPPSPSELLDSTSVFTSASGLFLGS